MRKHAMLSVVLVPLALAPSPARHADQAPATVVTESYSSSIPDADKAKIFSGLIAFCRYSLEDNSNAVSRCQLYAQWGEALERKLRLEKAGFLIIRRQTVVPYLAGLRAAESQQMVVFVTAPNVRDLAEQLTKFRVLFKQRIVALYSQPPHQLDELKRLLVKTIPNQTAAREIIEAVQTQATDDDK